MRTEAEHIADGIREYVNKLNELLELAEHERVTVTIQAAFRGNFNLQGNMVGMFSTAYRLRVTEIYRTEIL